MKVLKYAAFALGGIAALLAAVVLYVAITFDAAKLKDELKRVVQEQKQRTLDINGHVVQLRPDQALALYVTGSSQSDFAFDVSVHLWQRRPGRKGLASSDVDGLHMNTVDWYDTYIPCAVLHVPPGK